MTQDPTIKWPEEIKKAYDKMPIPSLYDFLLTNEKLSLEVRKQNRDVKQLLEGFQLLSTQLSTMMDFLTEELEEDEEEYDERAEELGNLEVELLSAQRLNEQKQVQNILIDTVDSLLELSQYSKHIFAHLYRQIQEPTNFKEVSYSLIDKQEGIRYKLMARLEDLNIQVIDPQPGEPFISQKHRALEQVTGGEPGTVARLIRLGYLVNNQILRYADVAVYT
jgi:molecular chaperone GrpE (heat shock protein)